MTTDTTGLAAEVEDIRSGLAALQDRFEAVMTEVRHLPGGEMVWRRVDAHPGVRLDRDMGAGKDADGWLAEVAGFLEDAIDTARGSHAWPEDLADGERIRVSGPGGVEEGTTVRVAGGDRLTHRSDSGVEREVHADDGVVVERIPDAD